MSNLDAELNTLANAHEVLDCGNDDCRICARYLRLLSEWYYAEQAARRAQKAARDRRAHERRKLQNERKKLPLITVQGGKNSTRDHCGA